MVSAIGVKSIDFLDLLTTKIDFNSLLCYFDKVVYDEDRLQNEMALCKNILSSPGDKDIRRKQSVLWESNLKNMQILEEHQLIEGLHYAGYENDLVSEEKLEDFADRYLLENLPFKMFWKIDIAGDALEPLINDYKFLQYTLDREMASLLNHDKNINSIPVSSEILDENTRPFFDHFTNKEISTTTDVIAFIINEFPTPEIEKIKVDRLIELRANEDLELRKKGLRTWINKVSKGKANPVEAKEEFEYLKAMYENHLDHLNIKYSHSKIEIAVITGLELIEDLVKIKWSAVAEKLFNLKRAKIDLLIAEDRSPGREVSYIHQLKKELDYLS